MEIVNRENKKIIELKYCRSIRFLYNNIIGRVILKLLSTRFIAKIVGAFMNTRFSCILKNAITKSDDFDINKFENIKYDSYNKYFIRKYKKEYLNVSMEKNNFISPCDGNLLIVPIKENKYFAIKQSMYTIDRIINDDIINEYRNGYMLIFRLNVTNYHRFCFIDNGSRTPYKYISGKLHTVQPIVYDKLEVFHENCREWCVLNTENFGKIIQVEVGALLIGKIVNNSTEVFKKGDEKGYFEFGGSTILLLVKDNAITFDSDILANSEDGRETMIKYGEKIGIKKER